MLTSGTVRQRENISCMSMWCVWMNSTHRLMPSVETHFSCFQMCLNSMCFFIFFCATILKKSPAPQYLNEYFQVTYPFSIHFAILLFLIGGSESLLF